MNLPPMLRNMALSVPDGRVDVIWPVKNDGLGKALVLEWVEINGPRVELPPRPGFGTALIERGIAMSYLVKRPGNLTKAVCTRS
jgi:two-component sensor histidine kinase